MRRLAMIVILALALSLTLNAGTLVWGNNATFGNVTLEAFDLDTGNLVHQVLAPNLTARAGNGRGIAVVGTTIYYTTADDGEVYVTNSNTFSDDGIAFDTGLNGLATVAWDGSALWVIGYNGTNNAYRYTTTGTLLETVIGFGNSRDGFEIAGNKIIANRGDAVGPYDLFNLDGSIDTLGFITTKTSGPTGITFNGTNYIVSDIFNNKLEVYDINGVYLYTRDLGGPLPQTCCGRLLEDLSSLGNIISNPPPDDGKVPEPQTYALVGVGLAAVIGYRRRRS